MFICRGNPPPENDENTTAIRNGVVATNNLMMQLRFGGDAGSARQKQKLLASHLLFSVRARWASRLILIIFRSGEKLVKSRGNLGPTPTKTSSTDGH